MAASSPAPAGAGPGADCRAAPGGGLTLVNVAADGERLRAVGSNGLVAAAARDLERWRVVPTPVEHDLRGVVWTGERWVVAGDVGTVLGKIAGGWSAAPGIPAVGLRGIAARPGLVAASGANGVVVTSADGLTWQQAVSGTTEILWGGVGVGSELWLSGRESTVVRSADGATWSIVPTFPAPTDNTASPRPFLWQLASEGEQVVAVGDFGAILSGTATTGLSAVASPTDEILRGVVFGGGRWVAAGSGGEVLYSNDGVSWSDAASPTTVDLRGVAYTGRRFVAVGDQSTVISSRDGERWRGEVTAMPCALLGVTAAGRQFVAVGGAGLVMRSRDGLDWSRLAPATTHDLYSASFGSGRVVAVGSRGTVLTSDDAGGHWTRRRADTRLNLHTVFWTGDEFLAGGDIGRVVSSPDGRIWERVDFPGYHSVRGFATDGANVVAAGAGTIARRAAGQEGWELEPIGFARFQTAIAYGDGRFVIVGHNGEALVSTDGGQTWTAGTSGVEVNLDAVIWTGQRFLATGEGIAIDSEDGLTWQPVELEIDRSLRALVARGSRVIGVGDGRTRVALRP